MAHTTSTSTTDEPVLATVYTYAVIFRMGGYGRFQWGHTAPRDMAESNRLSAELATAGYYARVVPAANLRHGLPTTWAPGDDVDSVTTLADGWLSQPSTTEVAR